MPSAAWPRQPRQRPSIESLSTSGVRAILAHLTPPTNGDRNPKATDWPAGLPAGPFRCTRHAGGRPPAGERVRVPGPHADGTLEEAVISAEEAAALSGTAH